MQGLGGPSTREGSLLMGVVVGGLAYDLLHGLLARLCGQGHHPAAPSLAEEGVAELLVQVGELGRESLRPGVALHAIGWGRPAGEPTKAPGSP